MPLDTLDTLEQLVDRQLGRRAFLKLTGLGVFTAAAASLPATLEAVIGTKTAEEALKRFEFIVQIDTMLSETAELAESSRRPNGMRSI